MKLMFTLSLIKQTIGNMVQPGETNSVKAMNGAPCIDIKQKSPTGHHPFFVHQLTPREGMLHFLCWFSEICTTYPRVIAKRMLVLNKMQ